jgi:hypothetical protein
MRRITLGAVVHAHVTLCLMAMLVFVQHEAAAETAPPYGGTVYIDKDWLTPSDPSIYIGKSYVGVETFEWFDLRNEQWTDSSAYSYELSYEFGIKITASIHTDNDQSQIDNYLDEWGYMLGQAPARLLQGLGEFQVVPAKVGDDGIRANGYTDPTHIVLYTNDPIQNLEKEQSGGWVREAIIHELGHATFGPAEESAEWLEAQATDPCFISDYARDNPNGEDVSESVMPYLMLRLVPERVSESDKTSINQCIQARSEVLDQWLSEESFVAFPWSPWPQEQSTLRVTLEEPAAELVHMGVGNLRGWAVSSAGIRKVEAFLDGEFLGEIPYGGARGDVGAAFPSIDGSGQSGFSMAFNYSRFSAGTHTIEVVAHGIDNKTTSTSAQFETVRFDREFIGAGEVIDLNAAASVLSNEQIQIENISIAGKSYNLLLRWRTAEQGFEIVEIQSLD